MHISIELDEATVEKLAYIQQQSNQKEAEVIERAIHIYYEQLQQEHHSPDSLEKLKQSPFIGSFRAEPNLSVNSKVVVREIFEPKK
jgi:hypothetical protein